MSQCFYGGDQTHPTGGIPIFHRPDGAGGEVCDAQWARIEPLLPDWTPVWGGCWWDHREVIDAIAFKFQTGTQWVHLPRDTCRAIKARGGEIRSFDGDRVMAVFMGDSKNSDAAECGLQIHHVVDKIVRPKVEANLPSITTKGFQIKHCVGIDSGTALIVRGGVRATTTWSPLAEPPTLRPSSVTSATAITAPTSPIPCSKR
ncbi:transposase [Streptomyces sp. NPDC026665]|uniref:transposase n=1 Tax=Streptomyces sp. NPDC026665 TaxID=3154798 RepID=UPI0033C6375B